MTRYERIKKILDSLPKESLRVCPSTGPCACKGCVTVHGVSKELLEKYKKGEL